MAMAMAMEMEMAMAMAMAIAMAMEMAMAMGRPANLCADSSFLEYRVAPFLVATEAIGSKSLIMDAKDQSNLAFLIIEQAKSLGASLAGIASVARSHA